MDPNEALAQIRGIVTEIETILADPEEDHDEMSLDATIELRYSAENLAHSVQVLDQWISNGGFLPGDWSHRKVK